MRRFLDIRCAEQYDFGKKLSHAIVLLKKILMFKITKLA